MHKVLSARKRVRRTATVVSDEDYQQAQHDRDDILDRSADEDAGDGKRVCPGEGQGSDRANAGASEAIDDMEEDTVQLFFELMTGSRSQLVRLLNRNLCSVLEKTYLQENIRKSDQEGNGAGLANKENMPGPDG